MAGKLELTAAQASEQLGISPAVLRRMVRDGVVTPINVPQPGAARFYARFNPADIRALKKARYGSTATLPLLPHENGNGSTAHPEPTGRSVTPQGISTQLEQVVTRLTSVEATLQRLLAVWL